MRLKDISFFGREEPLHMKIVALVA